MKEASSGKIPTHLESFIEYSNLASSVDELFKLFEREMQKFGYDRILMALMTAHPELNREAEHGILKNYPEVWVKHYRDQGYDRIDPVRSHIFLRSSPYSWDELKVKDRLSKEQIRMFNEAREEGLLSGIAVPLRGPNGAVAGIAGASSAGYVETTQIQLDTINLLAHQFYACFCRLLANAAECAPVELTSKEREVLKWCAKGYTKSEIGQRLCISSHTVDYHIRNSQRKLQARNIVSAVVRAISRGLLDI